MRLRDWRRLGFLLSILVLFSGPLKGQSGPPSDVIVLLGHSHVENWDVKSLGGFRTVNRGRGGDHTRDLVERFDRDVVAVHPRAVLVWAFDNDIMDAPGNEVTAATQRAETNLMTLVDMAKAHSIEPILTTELTIRATSLYDEFVGAILPLFGKAPYQERVNGQIVEGNKWVRQQVERRHLLLLDCQRVLADSADRRRPEFARPDGVHLTKEAYAAITAQADAMVRASLRR